MLLLILFVFKAKSVTDSPHSYKKWLEEHNHKELSDQVLHLQVGDNGPEAPYCCIIFCMQINGSTEFPEADRFLKVLLKKKRR